jgi:hypothetical protein
VNRLSRKLKTISQLLSVFLSLLILFGVIAFATTLTPPSEKYLQLYVLSSSGTDNNYFPNNSTYIKLGQTVHWSLTVVNDMGIVQFVAVRVKLGNQSSVAPNDTSATPSIAPLVTEFKQFIQSNTTWNIGFDWRVTNLTTTPDGHLSSIEFNINNATYFVEKPSSCTLPTCTLRLIFELWTWNTDSANFQLGWWNGNQHTIAWLQLWFNLTPAGE